MINMLKKLRDLRDIQSGDTIVEVMICVAVLTIVMLATFTSINRSYLSLEQNQERERAVKLVESQVEDLRAYGVGGATYDCFTYHDGSIAPATNNGVPNNNPCVFQGDGTEDTDGAVPAYTVAIKPSSGAIPITYTVTATWEGSAGSGEDNVSMVYRLQ
jgi:type II secretory pathway pseudopilin PulG